MVEPKIDYQTEQILPMLSSKVVTFPGLTHLQLLIFSYLHGYELFHKIAVTSKKMRERLPKAGLLDQLKEIGIIASDKYIPYVITLSSFLYAVRIANRIRITIDKT